MFIPDSTAKTVHIPIRIKDGQIEYFYEENTSFLEQIKDTVIAELIIPEHALKDDELKKKLNAEHEVVFLKKGTILLAEMKIEHETDEMKHFLKSSDGYPFIFGFEIELLKDQKLILRGSKKAKLSSCECKIPFLKQNAISLNHAYTLISQKVEISRSSHSGNVFNKLFYLKDGHYEKIGALRDEFEADFESELIS